MSPAQSQEEAVNPKDLAGRAKPQLHLIPLPALVPVARVMELGAAKYGPHNWRDTPIAHTPYISAMMRHLIAYAGGESVDPESGQSHLAHIASGAMILLDAVLAGVAKDDRPGGVARTPANDDVQTPAGSVIPSEIFYADLSAEWASFAEHQRNEYRVQRRLGATMEDALREARIHRETVVVSSESFIERWHALSERQKDIYWKLLGTARTEQAQDRALLAAERAQWCTAAL